LIGAPSKWVVEHATLIRRGGRILDLACGSGRHAVWLAGQGYRVDAVDRDAEALAGMQGIQNVDVSISDIETGNWPAADPRYGGVYNGIYDGIVVSRYLFRPLLSTLAAMLKPDGVLIYETFMLGNEDYGRPSNLDYLLQPDELKLVYTPLLKTYAFEQGKVDDPVPAVTQRICAINSHSAA
jgi:SAM-dependent methyltransferase